MKPVNYAGYVIAPLHLVAGFLFALLPDSPYQQGYSAIYGTIATLLVTTVVAYHWILRAWPPGLGAVWGHLLLATAAATLPLYLVDFSNAGHAIVYPLILGASLLACLVVGHLTVLLSRR
jgi:hypothetical protein